MEYDLLSKEDIEPKLKEIVKYIKAYKIMCYVLIGFNSTEVEDLHRVQVIDKLGMDRSGKGIDSSQRTLIDFLREKEYKVPEARGE